MPTELTPRSEPPAGYRQSQRGIAAYVITHLSTPPPFVRPELTVLRADSDIGWLNSRRWSELAAMYQVWQGGPHSGIVGFSHYRRYLSFHPDHREPILRLSVAETRDACYDPLTISTVSQHYAIVPKPWRVDCRSVAEQYQHWHHFADYELTRTVLGDLYPAAFVAEFDRQATRQDVYVCNLFYLRWAEFSELCRFWFAVLGIVAQQIPWPRDVPYQDRDVGYLSERLFDVWIRIKQKAGLQLDERPMLVLP